MLVKSSMKDPFFSVRPVVDGIKFGRLHHPQAVITVITVAVGSCNSDYSVVVGVVIVAMSQR